MEKLEKLKVEKISSQSSLGKDAGSTTRLDVLEQNMKAHERATTKVCITCKIEKDLASYGFIKNRGNYKSKCKKCNNARSKVLRDSNPDTKQKEAAYREKNRERMNTYRKNYDKAHPEKKKASNERCMIAKSGSVSEYKRQVYHNNPASYARANIKRKRSVSQAIPLWYDEEAVKQIYRDCKAKSIETGILHHVDHICPLNHPLVSGLHVQNNLRIITAKENLSKSNKLVDDIVSSTARVVGTTD